MKGSRKTKKNIGLEYLKKVTPLISKASLFSISAEHPSSNVFVGDKASKLDDGTITDLLSISSEGKCRMISFVSYVHPQSKMFVKKRKLAIFSKKPTTQFNEKQKTNKVTLLLK